MKYLEWFMSNWFIIFAALAAIIVVGALVYQFLALPTGEQKQKIKEWLIYACSVAEKELGGGTGKLKLRMVYDAFLAKFTWLSRYISFEDFSALVDEALVDVREMLENNKAVGNIINGESEV